MSIPKARELADHYAAEMRKGINPNVELREKAAKERAEKAAKGLTLEKALKNYLADSRHLKKSTIAEYKNSVNNHLKDWKARELVSITREEIKASHRKISRKYPQQANKVLSHLRAIWNYCAEEAALSRSGQQFPPWPLGNRRDRRSVPNPQVRRTNYVAPGDMPAWFDAVLALPETNTKGDGELARDYLLFLLLTGCRRREATAIRCNQVNLRGKILTITDTKNGKPLDLPITPYLGDLLERRVKAVKGRGFLFPIVEPKRFVEIVRKESGVYFTLHCLRRTLMTIAESLDISSYALKALVNHSVEGGSDVTAGYVQINVERLRDPAARITDTILRQAEQLPANVVSLAASNQA
jgi:integrase